MPELTLKNVDQIIRDIREQDIVFSHLADDLIDHVCCDVEYEMTDNLSFEEAYKKVKLKIGTRRIQEIQEETLYAVDTKYRNMKNTMKISGVIATVLLGFSAILKIQHLPFAGILLTLGAIGLALVFMPSALNVLWKESKSGRKIFLFISAFFSSLFFILGMLFKIQHWPGSGIMILIAVLVAGLLFIPALLVFKMRDTDNKRKRPLYVSGAIALLFYVAAFLFRIMNWPFAGIMGLIGWLGLVFVTFPWYTVLNFKDDKNISARFIFISIAIPLIVVPSALINLNLGNSYEKDFFDHLNGQEALLEYQTGMYDSYRAAYETDLPDTVLIGLENQRDRTISIINDIEKRMISMAEGEAGIPVASPRQISFSGNMMKVDYRMLSEPFMRGPFNSLIMSGTEGRISLENALSDYMNSLSETAGYQVTGDLGDLLTVSTYIGNDVEDKEISLVTALHSLDLMKNSVMAVHSYVIGKITDK